MYQHRANQRTNQTYPLAKEVDGETVQLELVTAAIVPPEKQYFSSLDKWTRSSIRSPVAIMPFFVVPSGNRPARASTHTSDGNVDQPYVSRTIHPLCGCSAISKAPHTRELLNLT